MLSGGEEGSKEEEKFRDKVYSRKSAKRVESSKSGSDLLREQQPKFQGMVSEGLNSKKRSINSAFDVGSDNFSAPSRDGVAGKGGLLLQENKVRISLAQKSKQEVLELRRKLESERDMIRSLMRKIEANEQKKNAHGVDDTNGPDLAMGVALPLVLKPPDSAMGVALPRVLKPPNELNVLVNENKKDGMNSVEQEKRTPKANKMYRNSDFLLAKDKCPPDESRKKTKSNVKKGGRSELGTGSELGKFPNKLLKSCNALLERLMKHKHGWVFNKPVDAVALGLHDYFDIIKTPMDLGTVKDMLTQNRYKSPLELAEDVRLTFQNAMTYNPKGQDVYVMAETLSKTFEDKWAPIEAEYMCWLKSAADSNIISAMLMSQKAPPPPRARPDLKRPIGRSESMSYVVDPKGKAMNTAQSGKISRSKKPKAKDPIKREMTFDEKQKLSVDLQSLPSEKLENVVQIIKKRNPNLSQQDDEIEVDIDTVDTETLWDLDRFITNYKKSLSKNKRKAEIVSQLTSQLEQNMREKIAVPTVTETRTEEKMVSPPVEVEEHGRTEPNHGASQSSSTDSGSSSSDSDGESS